MVTVTKLPRSQDFVQSFSLQGNVVLFHIMYTKRDNQLKKNASGFARPEKNNIRQRVHLSVKFIYRYQNVDWIWIGFRIMQIGQLQWILAFHNYKFLELVM